MNDSIVLKRVSRKEFEKIRPDIATKNPRTPGNEDQPETHVLTVPDDLKNGEIPLVMKKINEIAYGGQLPDRSAFATFGSKLETYLAYLESSEAELGKAPGYPMQYVQRLRR